VLRRRVGIIVRPGSRDRSGVPTRLRIVVTIMVPVPAVNIALLEKHRVTPSVKFRPFLPLLPFLPVLPS
jgi:hypothetical protein